MRKLSSVLFLVFGLTAALTLSQPQPFLPDLSAATPPPGAKGQNKGGQITLRTLPLPTSASFPLAVRRIGQSNDSRYIAPLIDVMPFTRSRDNFAVLGRALGNLTGERIDRWESPWHDLMVWYGERPKLRPPPGYIGWKGQLFSLVDPRFRLFLYDRAPTSIRVEEIVWGGVVVDGLPALVNPKTTGAEEAGYLRDTEAVFGVSINGDHRAYPLRILDSHEMANDVVGGKPVTLAYCTLCGAGILFDTAVGETSYEFGSSGLLYRSNKLMYDRKTRSLWNQITGEPVVGKLVGSGIKLPVLPIVLTSWGEWKRRHPDTSVLNRETKYRRDYAIGAFYGDYFASPNTMFPVWKRSQAFPKKERIFAIRIDGVPKAYPLHELNRGGGVVNDTLGSKPLVVIYRDAVGRVALPETWRQTLTRLGGSRSDIAFANDLNLKTARKVIKKRKTLLNDLTAEMLLAMPTETRLALLTERTPKEKKGSEARKGMFAPDFRNEVALRGLIGETRAYERGPRRFRSSDSSDKLLDEQGRGWRVTESALVGPDDERLPRLGGHLAYWFGWFSFFPQTEVYKSERAYGVLHP